MTAKPAPSMLQGGIIAAGEGRRLLADGYSTSKPMVTVCGRPLIGHTLDRFRAVGIERLSIIINETSDDCRQWLRDHAADFDLNVIVRSTPSSYASFQLVVDRLARTPALVTTIDTVMPVEDFRHFVRMAASFADDAVVLGVTDHVDDDNPLWAVLNSADGRITHLGGSSGSHVTAGLYWLPAKRPATSTGAFARLRDYLSSLVANRHPVYGVVLPRVFDIDRARDIAAAELAELGLERVNTGA
jgi:NDP-sugar pyrophosphorylase family protein